MENRSKGGFMFAVMQTRNEPRIPSISEMPGYQHFVGQHIKNLYDVYFQESLSDSSSVIDEFIQKYGLDRILHQGELDALSWKNSGTYFYKIYRDSAYEILETIPVDVFDQYVAENAIQAYAQTEVDKSLSQSTTQVENNSSYGFNFLGIQSECQSDKPNNDESVVNPQPVEPILRTLYDKYMSLLDDEQPLQFGKRGI